MGMGGKFTEHYGPGPCVGPGQRLVWSVAASAGPDDRPVLTCGTCGGPNVLGASACAACGADFATVRRRAQEAPADTTEG
jgi:hypothetical protein